MNHPTASFFCPLDPDSRLLRFLSCIVWFSASPFTFGFYPHRVPVGTNLHFGLGLRHFIRFKALTRASHSPYIPSCAGLNCQSALATHSKITDGNRRFFPRIRDNFWLLSINGGRSRFILMMNLQNITHLKSHLSSTAILRLATDSNIRCSRQHIVFFGYIFSSY